MVKLEECQLTKVERLIKLENVMTHSRIIEHQNHCVKQCWGWGFSQSFISITPIDWILDFWKMPTKYNWGDNRQKLNMNCMLDDIIKFLFIVLVILALWVNVFILKRCRKTYLVMKGHDICNLLSNLYTHTHICTYAHIYVISTHIVNML